jgi:hypothetical protein
VPIYTPQCGTVSNVPTNIWQGRVACMECTLKCDKRNHELESSKCGAGKQIEEIITSKKVARIKNSKLLYRKERVINNFLRHGPGGSSWWFWSCLYIMFTVKVESK